jgi:hypothetical protein
VTWVEVFATTKTGSTLVGSPASEFHEAGDSQNTRALSWEIPFITRNKVFEYDTIQGCSNTVFSF